MLFPRPYGIPRITVVTYYRMRDYPDCAPGSTNASRSSAASGLKTFSIPKRGKRPPLSMRRQETIFQALRPGGAGGGSYRETTVLAKQKFLFGHKEIFTEPDREFRYRMSGDIRE